MSVEIATSQESIHRGPHPLARIPLALSKFARRKPLGAVGGLIVLILFLAAVFGPTLAPYHYNEYQLGKARLDGPSRSHIMGTDQLGRDVFSRLIYGARISVFVGLGVFAISSLLSTSLTLISGYYVTSVDLVPQRFIEVWQLLPPLIVLIAILGIYGATPLTLIVTLGILGGFNGSRILRSVVIQVRSMPYIEAAKAIAASDARIMLRHILPNVFYLIIVGSTAAVSGDIAAEAGLAILGFGVSPVYPTWGRMINDSREFLRVAPHMAVFPVMMLALTIYGFSLLGDALRDVLDPRLRGEGR